MVRDLEPLSAHAVDVLVIGGGIYALTIAYDAAQRGLSVALIERDDFGSGTSFNHLRTIHGGLRYLQTLDIGRARESLGERRTLARLAPHMVRPLRFAVPIYPSLLRGPTAMRAGLALDRIVAWDRNDGLSASHALPAGCVVSRDEAIQQFPGLRRQDLVGAAVFWDYVTTEADRLTFSYALAAASQGALLANHVEAHALLTDGKRVVGVAARDRFSDRLVEIAATVTVNATGGQVDRLLAPLGLATGLPLLKAMNLVTRLAASDDALGGRSACGRNLFCVPWRGRALFGTWESGRACDPDDTAIAEGDVAAFITELREAFPTIAPSVDDVTLVHCALVPAAVRGRRVTLEGHEQVRDHAKDGVEGLLSVAGTKYTTARAVASRITDRLLAKLHRAAVPCRTGDTPLAGSVGGDVRPAGSGLSADTQEHLLAAYGPRYGDVVALAGERSDWRARVAPESPVIGAELVWAARAEMAMTLSDAVIRRTPLGALGYPGDVAVARAAVLVGDELGWTEDQRREEIAIVKRFYALSQSV